MGSYLSTPVTRKDSLDGVSVNNPHIAEVAGSSMQGWRKNMEDAHICLPDLSEEVRNRWHGHSLFAVFDGHGGAEVAKFCATVVPELVLQKDCKNLEKLLFDVHHRLDELLRDERYCRAFARPAERETITNGGGAANGVGAAKGKGRGAASALGVEDTPAMQAMLQQSLQKDLRGAKEKGSLSTAHATNVMVKMMLLSQMRGGAGSGNSMQQTAAALANEGGHASIGSKSGGTSESDISRKADKGEVEVVPVDSTGPPNADDSEDSTGSPTSSSSHADLLRDIWVPGGPASADDSSSSSSAGKKEHAIDDAGMEAESLRGMQNRAQDLVAAAFPGAATGVSSAADGAKAVNTRSQSHPSSASSMSAVGSGRGACTTLARLMGCTAVQALVTPGGQVVVANAGDSRCVVCQNGGIAKPLSEDHKPDQQRETSRINAAGGRVEVCKPFNAGGRVHHRVNGNLNLSRAIGDLEYKQRADLAPEEQIICSTPDVVTYEIQPGDEFLVLACDGVWDMMSNQQCCDFVRQRLQKSIPLKKICEDLLDSCLADDPRKQGGLGGDNCTVLVIRFATGEDTSASASGPTTASSSQQTLSEAGPSSLA
eukprot:CAMPEP_0178993800 /NCGR_PEP_ID=MMETSP0795-20121207/6910_1 /TAXON_ID=88552 /ORGANISM="Amoebophrya sp., Strain Ameob2" /LENGTH=597 /DNA_ID=CAMNT_0020685911 /DNA_START=541 /DNA_END=2334 /DNA_ORIENTATION=+